MLWCTDEGAGLHHAWTLSRAIFDNLFLFEAFVVLASEGGGFESGE